jgi:hypothetical protein
MQNDPTGLLDTEDPMTGWPTLRKHSNMLAYGSSGHRYGWLSGGALKQLDIISAKYSRRKYCMHKSLTGWMLESNHNPHCFKRLMGVIRNY